MKYKYIKHLCDGINYDTYLKEQEARKWCTEMFGREGYYRWGFFIDGFNFNYEEDYMMFLLRWS